MLVSTCGAAPTTMPCDAVKATPPTANETVTTSLPTASATSVADRPSADGVSVPVAGVVLDQAVGG